MRKLLSFFFASAVTVGLFCASPALAVFNTIESFPFTNTSANTAAFTLCGGNHGLTCHAILAAAASACSAWRCNHMGQGRHGADSRRLSGTIYAEYDDLKTYIAKLEGQKTEQTFESLRSTWGVSVFDAERLVQKLVDIGFFQKKSSHEEDTYWVPFLYRDALRMSQGLAED